MDIEFIPYEAGEGKAKCTIHLNGKLGFSKEAINMFNIDATKAIKLGIDASDKTSTDIYLQVLEYYTEGAYKIIKAGNYFYLNTKAFFEKLNVEYKKKKIIYDIEDFEYKGIKMFKLKRRELDRKLKSK